MIKEIIASNNFINKKFFLLNDDILKKKNKLHYQQVNTIFTKKYNIL